jgi:hypothetical protein
MWKLQVVACCACSTPVGGMQRVRSRAAAAVRRRAEPGTKEADTNSSASAQEEGNEMDLVKLTEPVTFPALTQASQEGQD